MNKIETFVYGLVKNNYLLKNAIRNIYQGFYDLIPNKESSFAHQPIVLENCFFGFHDLNPFSDDNNNILSNRLTISLRMPKKGDTLEVGFWSGKDFRTWTKVGETIAWNYHKGCRLQWIDKSRCIFNQAVGDVLKAEIRDIKSGEKAMIDWPIDTVSKNGEMATSFSYERLQLMMPGYGYLYNDKDSYLDDAIPSNTGLFLINMKENTRHLLLDLKKISLFKHEEDMDDAFHFVTHTEFSLDNRYVAFLHRWYKGVKRKTRLIVCDLTNGELFASPTSGMVSHYAWNNKNGIVAYCSIQGIDSHAYFFSPNMEKYKRCGYPKLNSDGHHHFIDDENFVVDTYPDKYRHSKIYKVSIESDNVEMIADVRSIKKFASPSEQKHWACDLHPRCSDDGNLLSFDSVHTGVRSLCIIKL
jgi:hypothetical protein